jgi:hypothetical protein
MTFVILQPAGNQGGREHYVDTVENLVDIKSCAPYLAPQDQEILTIAHPDGKAGMWGVVPGKNDVNVGKWNRISVGDVVLFAADKKITSSAVVASKFTSERLAKHLWDVNSEGVTWKYMYSLDEIRLLDITYEEFNEIVGYKSNNVIQGFTVMDEDKSSLFLDHFALRSERHLDEVAPAEFEEAIINLDGELDRKAAGWHRKEQAMGRKRLLKGKTRGTCQLCGREMKSEFLIAAHIKRRSECEDHEKRDLDGVMMLACKFGCDYLFEVGFIGVNGGKLLVSPALQDQVAIQYSEKIKGRAVSVSEKQSKYFEWHYEKRFINLIK